MPRGRATACGTTSHRGGGVREGGGTSGQGIHDAAGDAVYHGEPRQPGGQADDPRRRG